MKGDEKEKRDKGIYKRMRGNSAKLTPALDVFSGEIEMSYRE